MKALYALFAAMFISCWLPAQTPVTNGATYGITSPSSACLSCPGSVWNNEMNITALDGTPADIDLENYGFCFQSSCFYSRYLQARQFGFSVPGTATILGIEVTIVRSAPVAGIIKDTIVNIMQSLSAIGTDRSAPGFWPATYTSQVYGSPTDLWGLSWTPANVNAPSMTVQLKIANTDPSTVTGVNVDYISMTVYYSTVTGIVESQTLSPNSFSVYQESSNELNITFTTFQQAPTAKLELYDVTGKLLDTRSLGQLDAGQHSVQLDIGRLTAGIYLVRYMDGKSVISRKVSIGK
ncbi:MAG: T9SS type A sorting domain-containing protein [Bacteroidia bacterium]